MSREEKQLELASDIMLQRVNEMKSSLSALIMKLEHDSHSINFPEFLDSYAVISGQMNSLMRLLRSDKVPPLRGLTVLPLSLNPEKDPLLVNQTEGRLTFFNHEVVPDYLRTKLDPDVETRHTQVELKAGQANQETIGKQAAALTKMANHMLDVINTAREDWEASDRGILPSTSSPADTQELVNALHTGKAFKIPIGNVSRPSQAQSSAPTPTPKAPGPSIKTNIKSQFSR